MTEKPETFQPTSKQTSAMELLAGSASNILLYGGSRSGKTFIFLRLLILRASVVANSTHAVLRKHLKDVKQKIGMRDLPDVFRICFPGIEYQLDRTNWVLTLPHNGSTIWLSGLDETGDRAEQILGMEFSTMYFNEASEITYHAMSIAKSRLAEKNQLKNQLWFDCNPPRKRHWLYKMFFEKVNPESNIPLKKNQYVNMKMNPADNLENIDEDYIENVLGDLNPTLRKRFEFGEFGDDERGKVFQQSWIDVNRCLESEMPVFKRIIVGVDPAMTSGRRSDGTGIIVVGVCEVDEIYVIDDLSLEKATPDTWSRAVTAAYHKWEANYVVAESNQGGDLVRDNLMKYDNSIPVKMVHAHRGKFIRAEPVAALYESGVVHHVGELPDLEDEMTGFDPDARGKSPDRMDALVYAITELGFKAVFRPRLAGGSHEIENMVEETAAPVEDKDLNLTSVMTMEQIVETDILWSR